MLEGVKLARRIAGTRPLVDLIDHEISPGDGVMHDDALRAIIEANLDIYHHGAATVPMGETTIPLPLSTPPAASANCADCAWSMIPGARNPVAPHKLDDDHACGAH